MDLSLAIRNCRRGIVLLVLVAVLYRSLITMSIDCDPFIDLLTIREAANLLRLSVSGVRRLQRQRRIPFIKLGGSIRFDRRDLANFLNKNRVQAIGS
jgi:excisionase family DNA binding protein